MNHESERILPDRERLLAIKAVLDEHIQQLPTFTELQQAVDAKRDSVFYSTCGKNLFYRGYFCPQLSRQIARNVSRGRLTNGNSKGKKAYRYSFLKDRLLHCQHLSNEGSQCFEEFILSSMPCEISAIFIGNNQQDQQLSEMTICQYENDMLQYFCTGSVSESNEIGYLTIEDYQYTNNTLTGIIITESSTSDFQDLSKWAYRYTPSSNEWTLLPICYSL